MVAIQGNSPVISLLKKLRDRFPGRLHDPDAFDLSLTGSPANKEEILMTKNANGVGVFDFTNASDGVKSAVALAHEAIKPHLEIMPEQVVQFFKSAEGALELEPEPKPKPDDGDDSEKDKNVAAITDDTRLLEMVKSALPGVVDIIQKPLIVQIQKSQEQIDALVTERDQNTMREIARSLIIPDESGNKGEPPPELVGRLVQIRKSMSDTDWNAYLEEQRSHIAVIEKSQLFARQSNSLAPGANNSAYNELKTIADSIIEKSETKNPVSAWNIACQQNPVLYQRYMEEQRAGSRTDANSQV